MAELVLDTTPTLKRRPGRPRGDNPHKVFSFGLTGDESVQLQRRAANMGMTTSAYLQRIIRRDLQRGAHH